MRKFSALTMVSLCALVCGGCWVAAGAVGAEAGYLASQEDRSIGETIDDQLLFTRVKSALVADKEVSGFDISVTVRKGVVELRGYLDSSDHIDRAIEVASTVPGVKEVDSRLVLDR